MAVNMCTAERQCFTSLVNHTYGYLRMSGVHLHTNCDTNLHLLNNAVSKQTACLHSKFSHSITSDFGDTGVPSKTSNLRWKQKCPQSRSIRCNSSHFVPNHHKCCHCSALNSKGSYLSGKYSKTSHSSKQQIGSLLHNRHRRTLMNVNHSRWMVPDYQNVHTSARNVHWNLELSNKIEPPWNVLFFGNDKISVATLEVLYENLKSSRSVVESLEVVTNPHKTVVRSFAEAANLPIQDWPIKLQPYRYNVGVLASFGHLIPDGVIGMFPYGIINMHPSKLPRWRGASPIMHTVLHGDRETAVCVTEIRPKHFDIGPILEQRVVPVPYRATAGQLTDLLAPIGGEMILESLTDLDKLERYEHEQDPAGITYAHMIKKQHFGVDWHNQTSEEVDQQYRAIGEMDHLKSEWKGIQARFMDVVDPRFTNDVPRQFIRGYNGDFYSAEPGTPAIHSQLKCLLIKCKTGAVGFDRVMVRKTMPAMAFYNGYMQGHEPGVFTSMENDLYKYTRSKRIPKKLVSSTESPPAEKLVLKAQH